MLEQLSRVKDVDGLPRVEIRTPQEFFERCKADGKDLPVWVGELYFELHRGTYTTQARNKLHNRRAETLMHNLEFLAAMAYATKSTPYPSAEIERLWKLILINQFHDIIPGSSIHEVYEDSEHDYAEIFETGERLLNETISALIPPGDDLIAINTICCHRNEVVELPFDIPTSQKATNGQALAVIDVENMALAKIEDPTWTPSNKVSVAQARQAGNTFILDNGNIQATFQNDGQLISLYHMKFEREAIEPGKLANHFILFDDHPNDWEAWDVDVFHLEKRTEVHPAPTMRIVENGPLRASLAFEVQLSPVSTLKQIVSIEIGATHLDFSTEVEWHEKHKFLKVEFPFNIRASTATYEVQYGCVERPTHFNTSWDVAKFEVCAQRWADLYEPGFGVALLNDCKYGYSTHGNVMRLSLLRGSTSPDEEADMGHHSFRYRLYPHQSPVWQIGLHDDARCFNTPLLIRKGRFEDTFPYFAINQDDDRYSVVLDTVKKAEDSNDLIARLYEAYGTHSEIGLVIARLPVKAVWRCNLLEQTEEKLEWAGGNILLDFNPFQIITLKLELDI